MEKYNSSLESVERQDLRRDFGLSFEEAREFVKRRNSLYQSTEKAKEKYQ